MGGGPESRHVQHEGCTGSVEMARQQVSVKVINHGLYDGWNRESKELPRFLKFTTEIPARLDIEFGYILEIKGAKRKKLTFEMYHPLNIHTADGESMPDVFTGEVTIPQNEYRFFLGDTVWKPIDEKLGPWRLKTYIDGKLVADKTLELVKDEGQFSELIG